MQRTDALGQTVRIGYDDFGNITELVKADGTRITARYNELQLPTVITEPGGVIRRNEYDDRGNLVSVTDPLGAVTRFLRDERGALVVQTDAAGNTTRITPNAAGLPVRVVEPSGAATTYLRDLFGRTSVVTTAAGATSRLEWTVEGKLARRTNPDGSTERAVYDPEGNEVRHVDALGNVTVVETTHFDLPRAEIRPDGSRTEIVYDTELRPVSVVDSRGQSWTYDYDAAGRLVREQDVNGRTVEYVYDAAGRPVERRDSAGAVSRFEYDAVGNLVRRSSGDEVAEFAYDPMGRLVRAANPDAELTYEFDAAGRVLAETVNGRTIRSRYDLLGRRIARRTPTGAETAWTYDASPRPVSLHTAGRTITFGYDPTGNETERLLDSGVILAQAWDLNGRLVSQTLSRVAGTGTGWRPQVVQDRRYRYRPDGHVTAIEDRLGGNQLLSLDALGRITESRGPAGVERYAYDARGAITAAVWPGADPEVQGVREYQGSLVRRAGNVTYDYDERGRVVMRRRKRLSAKPDIWRYAWSPENRLVGVVTPDGTRWRYRYDPLGRRIAKERLAPEGTVVATIDFVWDGAQLAEQIESSGRAKTWTAAGLQPLTQTERVRAAEGDQDWVDAQFYAIVTDLVGTPRELVDSSGELAWRAQHSVWGRALAELTATANTPLRAPGQYFDPETGLHYNLNRFYDPDTGRYASPDPLGAAPGPDPHAYVHNPVIAMDPAGLAEMCLDKWKEKGPEVVEELDWTHGEKVANGVKYNFDRMDPGSNEAAHVASHNLPGIGRDPYKMADYFKQMEGRGQYVEFDHAGQKPGVRVHYDNEKQVIIIENDRMVHGYRMSPEEWARKVQQGRYREG
ncbi:RHS repeat-associated core domain-containing protein [Amycolatopsis taiwanensis]|uniref:RHS repeat-associated core domain-containing protein n=1 Tax=Amycolatopsis taiwanensis TaxID=342230 RepID=UPI00255576B8|nr:RHS repeat-associated core domain-containing protein [Amycolatopsis taiwanensis]